MEITVTFEGAAEAWLRQQADPAAAIREAVTSHINAMSTPFDRAVAQLRAAVPNIPMELEFEVPQAVGYELWNGLGRTTKLALGKHIRANCQAFDLLFVRKTSANHAVYRRHG